MLRSTASKLAWVGRTASMVFGLALVLALIFGAATTALSATGGNFILGKSNTAGKQTSLVGTVAKAAQSALVVVNKGTGSALRLQVTNTNSPPMKVNSSAKVANLNADTVDGKSDTDFYAAGSKVADSSHADQADSATSAADANTLDGKSATDFAAAYKRTVVVSPTGTDTENGQALLDALKGIADASESKPYLIYIEPGTYDLGTSSLQMQEYVDIQGAGELNTLITSTSSESGCYTGAVRGASNAELRFLTAQNTAATTGCAVGIYNSSVSPQLTQVTAKATGSGGSGTRIGVLNNNNSAPTMEEVTATASGGYGNFGVSNMSGAAPTMEDVTATASGGNTSRGVANTSASAITMTNLTATASGGITNFGVNHVGNASTIIKQSTLNGSTNSLYGFPSSTVKVASTQLVGPVSSGVTCFNNYNENMAAVTCPQ